MRDQSVVISDAKTNIGVRLRVSVINPSGYPSVTGGYVSITRKKLIKKIESDKMNTWVDSLRSSSPSRTRPTSTQLTDDQEFNSWMVDHPSALSMFEEITDKWKGMKIVMFLDYDGTLSPIVEDPDQAYITDQMREAVKDVATYFPTAIVTGRGRDKVQSFVRLSGLYYAGSHGMDITGPSKNSKYNKCNEAGSFQPANASEFLPMIHEVCKILVEKTKSTPGAYVENNKFCVSVHFRRVHEKKWVYLVKQVREVVNKYPKLKVTHGRKVLEIRPIIKWDKGKALEFLLESLGFANSKDVLPVYIGDDRTDEDAFKVLRNRGQGLGILVSKFPKETNASYSLREPSEVEEFLRRLVEWKKMSLRGK